MKLFIIIEHGNTSGQYHDCQYATKAGKDIYRTFLLYSRRSVLVHFFAEITDRPVICPAFLPKDILSGDHIILHQLVTLIINTVASQLIKAICGCNIDRFFPIQTAV